ncbi:biotin--[acetyl-CoA-carboxylase] ligase [Sporosarcina gallistercoris]|uniref:Bifunctional ligase/repressor BirA n=1 Tax=Sporosarcina gallistercoris TaxID=2762245 RepID=A0ABR8PFI1_9BACL|nr:biotin--[acetyl-CoA-carboxylase] ligase [Sporosarcina gallistercoris]MBD7906935.1 biotin--[acetyl-CoA-carboxylase] ligase [Sporosarcina gallistercoris]
MNTNVKSELLKRMSAGKDHPVSGQQLAEEYGVSRTAIWKYVKELESEGYEIGSIRKRGYYLIDSPDTILPAAVQQFLQTKQYGRTIRHIESCPSTQMLAHEEAQNGAPDGMVIIADEQTAGKGRLSRPWSSAAGKGIWMSVITRPELTPQQAPQMTLVAAVAIVRAIEELTEVTPTIKWPNDILAGGRKLTGILTELQADPDRVKAIILGIGMNVNQQSQDFPEEIRAIATSLSIEEGQPVNRAKLTAKVLDYLELYVALYVDKGFTPIKLLWESYADSIGKRVRISTLQDTYEATARGISEDGRLEVVLDDGTVRGIYSADIHII